MSFINLSAMFFSLLEEVFSDITSYSREKITLYNNISAGSNSLFRKKFIGELSNVEWHIENDYSRPNSIGSLFKSTVLKIQYQFSEKYLQYSFGCVIFFKRQCLTKFKASLELCCAAWAGLKLVILLPYSPSGGTACTELCKSILCFAKPKQNKAKNFFEYLNFCK